MSLNIGLLVEGTRPPELEASGTIDLDDDGYYWFLYPLFESLHEQTGQMVDLYGAAMFKGTMLTAFQNTIADARRRVEAMPEQWQVQTAEEIGSYLHPKPPTPVFSTVNKSDFTRLLKRFDDLIAAAVKHNRCILCSGD